MNAKKETIIAIASLSITLLGCRTSLDSIPTGHWEGEGTWTSWDKNEQGKKYSGQYRANVTISKEHYQANEVMVIAVVSDHCDDDDFGLYQINAVVALIEPELYINGSTVCNTYADVADHEEKDAPKIQEIDIGELINMHPVPPARLSRFGNEYVLEINYDPIDEATGKSPFMETYTFEDDRLIKKG